MNPRRGDHADLFGVVDKLRGLHHLSFACTLGYQYEWPVHMWQMNKDFPAPGVGIDALYGAGGARNVGGGYFFVPAAPATSGDFFGSALLRSS
jgi:deferrochelatase/peroxidase EfeB